MGTTPIPSVEELSGLLDRLAGDGSALSDAERIDLISALESLKSGAAAAQARLSVAFDASQRRDQASRGVPARRQGLGTAAQIALARRDSPHRGGRHLGLARALVSEMPHTLAALTAGRISEWRAALLVRETAVLSAPDRARVDAALADRLAGLGDRGVVREARKLAYELDPGSVVRRMRRATADRRVTIRPAPDTMSHVSGLLPVAQGVAVHRALSKHADAARAAGDPRSRGQIMTDTLVERVTGQSAAPEVPVEIQLVMTDRTLLAGDHSSARILGHGPVPAALARSLVRAGEGKEEDKARVWVRRLFRSPETADLVAMESRRREFPASLRQFLVIRDEVCRTPWCDDPIRHADHAVRSADGGETSAVNGQGLCEACNLAKEAAGWAHSPSPTGAGPVVAIRTPTGHRYTSSAPDPPGTQPRGPGLRRHGGHRHSILEPRFERITAAA